MEKNPWKINGEKLVYDNPWIKVTEFDVLNPAGGKGIYGVVHFKNTAVGIIPLDENHNTWIVGQYRFPTKAYSWEIPEGGGVIQEQSPLDAAKRELKEETGLVATQWEEILHLHVSNSVTDEEAFVFVARGLTEGEWKPEDTEALQLRKIPFAELVTKVLAGEIKDAITVAAVLKLNYLLQYNKI